MYRLDLHSQISLILAILSWIEGAAGSVRCLKDDTVPDWYPVNVYYCNNTLKPICCNDGTQFTCCEPSGTVQLRDQIVTWVVIFGFIAFVVMVWCCFRKETHICETDDICCRCCSRCCPCCDCCHRTTSDSEGERDFRSSQKTPFETDRNESSASTDEVTEWSGQQQYAYHGSRMVKWNGDAVENGSHGEDNGAFHYTLPTSAAAVSGAGSGIAGKDMLAVLRDKDDANLIDV